MVADTTVKYFTSAMTGAPSLANVAGNLIDVLDACLVTGFGLKTCDSVVISGGVGTATISTGHSAIEQCVVLFEGATSPAALNGERKVTAVGTNTILFDASDLADGTAAGTITVKLAPAGWTKAFSGTNLAAYKSGNPAASGMLARFDDTTTTYASVRGYETMTDINTGVGVFPTTTQQAHSSWAKSNSASTKPWWIIANDRCVYFGVAPNSSYSSAFYTYCFGDIIPRRSSDPYRFCIMNNTADASSQVNYTYNPVPVSGSSGSSCGKYLPRSYSGFSSPVTITQTWLGAQTTSGYTGMTFPNPEDNALIMTPMVIQEGATYRGELPGIYPTPQAISTGIADGAVIKDVPGLSRNLVYRLTVAGINYYGGVFFDITGPWSS